MTTPNFFLRRIYPQQLAQLMIDIREEEKDIILEIISDYEPSAKSIFRCPTIKRKLIVRLPAYIKEIEKEIKAFS